MAGAARLCKSGAQLCILLAVVASTLEKLAFDAAQAARIGWFFSQKMLAARFSRPVPPPPHVRGRTMPDRQRLLADTRRLIEMDWENIAAGLYAPPEDLRGSPLEGLRRAVDFFADLPATDARRHSGPEAARLPEADPERYPAYYRRKFHFQSDGYLSEASAERYDYQVEVLFGGAAAPMRRQALVPLREALQGRTQARLLDVACGTGAFLREIKRNYPRLSVAGLDLSAPYLGVAARRLTEWSRVELVEGTAEAMPFGDAEFDVVTCVYLFHELPPRVRQTVAAEIARVLKPGGRLILVDSLQTGDEPDYDAMLDYFPVAVHEPYYASYIRTDLDQLFAPALQPHSRALAYFSKIVSYRRGAEGGAN
ncbi:MAG: class I SAM-dependent methyltransferase [Alphaproteobacteria bacterium]|nr:class I SAM-dependent methyltransferase [Alphaproteobacteria bacterium]